MGLEFEPDELLLLIIVLPSPDLTLSPVKEINAAFLAKNAELEDS
jgi:hypothetical protein